MSVYDQIPDTNQLVVQTLATGEYRQSMADALERAYQAFIGCYIDHPDMPPWARAVARYERDMFRAEAPMPKFSEYGSALHTNPGRGKRAVLFNYAMKLDRLAYIGQQNYGNCVFASMGWKTMTHLLAVQILGLKEQETWLARHGTVWYCMRGHCGQGSTLARAAHAIVTLGIQTMRPYGRWDFSDEDYDEKCGNDWCRSGPPDALVAETKKNLHKTVSELDDDSEDAWMDVLYNGGSIHTGSTTTAAKNGDPISSFTSVGGHAQSIIGYDDTEEFRDWYTETTGKRISYPVVIFSQTWGNVNYLTNWPEHLWGRKPQGAFVLPLPGVIRRMRGEVYAYLPNTDGYKPNTLTWEATP